ncbi:hypothetical protein BT69DRAFT_1290852 [Atractiella rhizophila]|nr:hypothetical protein BT69DRAFT_1290852 [Atractiella rhizophila]
MVKVKSKDEDLLGRKMKFTERLERSKGMCSVKERQEVYSTELEEDKKRRGSGQNERMYIYYSMLDRESIHHAEPSVNTMHAPVVRCVAKT